MSVSKKLHVIPSPFIKAPLSYKRMLTDKLFAICVLALSGIFFWGIPALITIAISTSVAVITEFVLWKMMGKKPRIQDYSAIIIGVGFALLLPIGVPLWLVALGSFFCILFGKMIFGGIAYTPFPPVAVGYAMVAAAWGKYLNPSEVIVGVELLDPLTQLKTFGVENIQFTIIDFILGKQLAVIGGTSIAIVVAIIAFLMIRRVLNIFIVLGYIAGVLITSFSAYIIEPTMYPSPLFFISTGTVLLSLIVLLSDFGSIPISSAGRITYGIAVGVIVVCIRVYTNLLDGTPLAILLASFLVPYCDMIHTRDNDTGGR